MEPPSSPSSTITAPPNDSENAMRLAKMIAEAMTCRFALLHYDSASKSMVEWCWPADHHGTKIPPSGLEKYRNKYEFRFPCCLCADSGGRETYVEAAVYSWWDKATQRTYWTARCASNMCGYQAFGCLPISVKRYAFLRCCTTALLMNDKAQEIGRVKLEWSSSEQTELLNKLKSSSDDGITVKEFRVLFKWCTKCMRVGIRPVMNRHICSRGVQKGRRRLLFA
ncbi:hypothetical protein P692DRAFT_20752477 [Suillus brevipes Sb2]|nr:hypothetical protein P692DRAFT_20752477 [Suillus brevipes Sb2]